MYDRKRRLVAAGLLPERAGQPVKVWAHVSLAELRALDDGSVLAQEWVAEMAVWWAGRRAAASQAGGDGAAWLDGKAASAVSCDATVIPVVTGQVDPPPWTGWSPCACSSPATAPTAPPAGQGRPATCPATRPMDARRQASPRTRT
jgi:hypothetical protein